MEKHPVVRQLDRTRPFDCPYGHVYRIVTGGEGGVANVHLVQVERGEGHFHADYDEVYYVLDGSGTLTVGEETHPLRPGSVAVIPAGCVHALDSATGAPLKFVIFGTPACAIESNNARPQRPE